MIWSDRDILNGLSLEQISIEPFDKEALQPASVDLRLSDTFLKYPASHDYPGLILDPTKPLPFKLEKIKNKEYVIQPRSFLLGVTREKIGLTHKVVGRVEGKSSIGRLALTIHSTAGFIDPGFNGHITLEIFNQNSYAIELKAGMYIAQIAFQSLATASIDPYGKQRGSRYTDSDREEPLASRNHEKSGLD